MRILPVQTSHRLPLTLDFCYWVARLSLGSSNGLVQSWPLGGRLSTVLSWVGNDFFHFPGAESHCSSTAGTQLSPVPFPLPRQVRRHRFTGTRPEPLGGLHPLTLALKVRTHLDVAKGITNPSRRDIYTVTRTRRTGTLTTVESRGQGGDACGYEGRGNTAERRAWTIKSFTAERQAVCVCACAHVWASV